MPRQWIISEVKYVKMALAQMVEIRCEYACPKELSSDVRRLGYDCTYGMENI